MTEEPNELIARTLVNWSQLVGTSPVVRALGVDCSGALYLATAETQDPLAFESGVGIFPNSELSERTNYTIHQWREGEIRTLEIPDEPLVVDFVQPTRDGVLLASARCRLQRNGPEQNAVEYTWTGQEKARFTLGDGIEDVRTTPDGSIWVSYFDEGVFGNYGWQESDSECVAAMGCGCFDFRGVPRFSYSAEEAGTEEIYDTYALNVSGNDDVWLYFYAEFPIVHIKRGKYETWSLGAEGAHGLAIDDSRALLFGSYEQRNLLRGVSLSDQGNATIEATSELVDDRGTAVTDAIPRGVGSRLYLFQDSRVLLLEDW